MELRERERDRIEDTGKHMDVAKSRMRQISVCHIDDYEEWSEVLVNLKQQQLQQQLRGLSPHANYTDRAAAAGRRS